jgi:hypothetical protein
MSRGLRKKVGQALQQRDQPMEERVGEERDARRLLWR